MIEMVICHHIWLLGIKYVIFANLDGIVNEMFYLFWSYVV
jgi:hypothetical protein